MTDITVCVATIADLARLSVLLESLRAMRTARSWELLLVLNGDGVAARTQVAAVLAGLPAKLIEEPARGKSRALNRALAEARGELLVFTDDDVTVDAAWLEQLAAAAQAHPQMNVFGGKIEVLGDVPAWVRRSGNLQQLLLSGHDLGPADRVYATAEYPLGPNMAVRRSALNHARWPVDRGPGTPRPVGDEPTFLSAISAPDAQDRLYVAGAVVRHAVAPGYFALSAALRRCYVGGYAAGDLARAWPQADLKLGTRAARRAVRLRSLREFSCVAARALGFFQARLRPRP